MKPEMTHNAKIPDNEEARIETLRKYQILDTPPDGSFDRITQLAAQLLNVPIAIVTLVDTDRIWFKSKYGLDAVQISRDPGLCASAILSSEFYQVEDAANDPRTLSNPLVAGEFGLRFYAAVPIQVTGGHNLGTLCVIDKQKRTLTKEEQQILQHLTDILIDQIELRLEARIAVFRQNQLLNTAAHELRTPLTVIPIWAQFIREAAQFTPDTEKMCCKIEDAAVKMNSIINEMLETAALDAQEVKLKLQHIALADVVDRIVEVNQVLAAKKGQQIHLTINAKPIVNADEVKFGEILDNLLNNAVKYTPAGRNISVQLNEEKGNAVIEIMDEGPGFTEEDKKNLFKRFSKLSARPTNGEPSTGLGLSIVKLLVDAHQATIAVESPGVNDGAKFTINIPTLN